MLLNRSKILYCVKNTYTQLLKHTMGYKILVTHPEVPKEAIDLLKESCEVIQLKTFPPDYAEILANVKDVDGIFWASHEKLNEEVIVAAGSKLKSVSVMSAGYDYVDVEAFKKHKIPIGHTPKVLSDAVADLAVGLLIAAARRFQDGRNKIETGTWESNHLQWLLGQDLRDAVIGFFGFGDISRGIAKRLKGFDIDSVLYTTRTRLDAEIEAKFNAKHVPFNELLSGSDFVVIGAPLTPQTAGIFNAEAFAKMKKTAVLVNIARGGLIDQPSLVNALKTGQIFAAGLDVMTPEPLPKDDELLSLPNCVVIPHLGSATYRTRSDMAIVAAHNVLRGIAGEPMLSPIYQETS